MTSPAYRPDIDGLRAFAVSGVVLFHLREEWLPGGYVGVDIFFVISGYLISLIVFRSLDAGQFSFRAFYARRVARLFPALFLVLLATLALGWLLMLVSEYAALGRHALAASVFLLNFMLAGEAGYFDVDAGFKPLLHLWSLCVEEQFYLLYPALAWLFWRARLNRWTLLVGVAAASLASSFLFAWRGESEAFFLPWSRFWELMLGGALAAWRLQASVGERWLQPASEWLAWAGLALMLGAYLAVERTSGVPLEWTLAPCLGAAAVIVAGPDTRVNRLFSNKLLVGIGIISYPLYLWHWPLLSIPRIVSGGHIPLAFQLAAIVLALTLSWLTWRYFERPARRAVHGDDIAARGRIVFHLVAGMATLAIAAWWIHGDGLPGRLVLDPYRTDTEQGRLEAIDSGCASMDFHGERLFPYCRLGGDGRPPGTVVIGDSHAHAFFPGLVALAGDTGRGILLLANSSCPPLFHVVTTGRREEQALCEARVEQILEAIEARPELKDVFIATRGPVYLTGRGYGPAEAGYREMPIHRQDEGADVSPAELWRQGMQATVDRLNRAGRSVTLLLQTPELGVDPAACRPRPFRLGKSLPCGRDRATFLADHADYRAAMRQVRGVVRVVDLAQPLCREARCLVEAEGRSLYADDNHLSIHGAQWVASQLAAQFSPVFSPQIHVKP